jgi:hypothetical protein
MTPPARPPAHQDNVRPGPNIDTPESHTADNRHHKTTPEDTTSQNNTYQKTRTRKPRGRALSPESRETFFIRRRCGLRVGRQRQRTILAHHRPGRLLTPSSDAGRLEFKGEASPENRAPEKGAPGNHAPSTRTIRPRTPSPRAGSFR